MDTSLKHRINAGRVAVESQVEFFHDQFANVVSDWKEDDTRVTFADFAISQKVFAELRRSFPKDDFCSEEDNPYDEVLELNAPYAWVLDPIDGTNNYALGIPMCSISLALLKDGIPVYGFVYDMARRTMIHGGPGQGVEDGRNPARVKPTPLDEQSLIGLQTPLAASDYERLKPVFLNYRLRSLGSAVMNSAYTAVGILDGVVDYRVKVWDIAAGWALIKGGGGEFCFLGDPVFPLRRFHVHMPPVPYFAGTASFCSFFRELV